MKNGTSDIVAPDSKLDPAEVGKMFEHLAGIDTGLLPRGDYNALCETLMVHLSRFEPICGASFPLFDRAAAGMAATGFLGYVTPTCMGAYTPARATQAVLDMCVSPCMESKTTKCCRVPSLVAPWFACCSAFACCPSDSTPPPTHGHCVDNYPTCPRLKKLFDEHGFDCYTSDVGNVTGNASLIGLHLVDSCCKTCTPPLACDAQCKGCMLFGSTSQCTNELSRDCTPCDATRRRAQAGAGNAVAQQVNGHARSKFILRKLIACLVRGPWVRQPHSRSPSPWPLRGTQRYPPPDETAEHYPPAPPDWSSDNGHAPPDWSPDNDASNDSSYPSQKQMSGRSHLPHMSRGGEQLHMPDVSRHALEERALVCGSSHQGWRLVRR